MSGYNSKIFGVPDVEQGEYKFNLQFYTNDKNLYEVVEKACQDAIDLENCEAEKI